MLKGGSGWDLSPLEHFTERRHHVVHRLLVVLRLLPALVLGQLFHPLSGDLALLASPLLPSDIVELIENDVERVVPALLFVSHGRFPCMAYSPTPVRQEHKGGPCRDINLGHAPNRSQSGRHATDTMGY